MKRIEIVRLIVFLAVGLIAVILWRELAEVERFEGSDRASHAPRPSPRVIPPEAVAPPPVDAGAVTVDIDTGPRLDNGSTASEIRARLELPGATPNDLTWALMGAIRLGDLALTKLAMDHGAEPWLPFTGVVTANSALLMAVQRDQPEIARYLASRGLDPHGLNPAPGAPATPWDAIQSDAMLRALAGRDYAKLRYDDVPSLYESAAECARPLQVGVVPDFVGVVERVLQRDGSGPRGFPNPDLVTVRALEILNADMLDFGRLVRATHARPSDRWMLPPVGKGANLVRVPVGRAVDLLWPPAVTRNRRLRPPPVGSRLIVGLDPYGAGPRVGAALRVERCLLKDTPANRAAVQAPVRDAVARIAAGLPSRQARPRLPPGVSDREPPAAPGQVLLQGSASDLAINAGPDFMPVAANPADIAGDVILDTLDVHFDPKASVHFVNAALRAVHGSISSRERGVWALTVHVPRARDAAELGKLAERVRAMPGILDAEVGTLATPK